MIGLCVHRIINSLNLAQKTKVPKILLPEVDKLKIAVINVNHFSRKQKTFIETWSKNYDILFLSEVWTTLDDIAGFDKFIYPSKYMNTLFIKSSIKRTIDINGFGFELRIADENINFMYIPPYKHKKIQLPNGIIAGDINWNTNKYEEPLYHEKSRLGRKGMSLINSKYEPTFTDYEYSDHQIMSFEIDYTATGYSKQIDVQKVPQRLIAAGQFGIYKTPYKIKDKTNANNYFSTSFWYRYHKRPNNKIFNSSMFGPKALKLWFDLLKHDQKKDKYEIISNLTFIPKEKIRSKARDTWGINFNDIIKLFNKYRDKNFQTNVLKAIKNNTDINTLMLKKKEFLLEKFNVKDFRLIGVLPTYLKLVEKTIDIESIYKKLNPCLVGFRPKMDVHTLIALINKNLI